MRRAYTALALLGAAVALLASAGPVGAHPGAGTHPVRAAAKKKPKPVKCQSRPDAGDDQGPRPLRDAAQEQAEGATTTWRCSAP